MSLFNNRDIEIVDAEILRRLIKNANQTHECMSNVSHDIQDLKRSLNEVDVELSVIKKDIKSNSNQDLSNVTEEIKTIKTTTIVMVILMILQSIMFGLFFIYILYPESFNRIL